MRMLNAYPENLSLGECQTELYRVGVEAADTKAALQAAKKEANNIFDYAAGAAGAPTVSVKPIPEESE